MDIFEFSLYNQIDVRVPIINGVHRSIKPWYSHMSVLKSQAPHLWPGVSQEHKTSSRNPQKAVITFICRLSPE